jgi:hypothetical protein
MAPIILRAMVDLYITLSWIFKDPLERSKKYIAYGLGQEKLEIAFKDCFRGSSLRLQK